MKSYSEKKRENKKEVEEVEEVEDEKEEEKNNSNKIEVEKDLVEIRDNICKDIIMVGDFNAHVGADEEGITGNNENTGINGHEYRRFFKERELV